MSLSKTPAPVNPRPETIRHIAQHLKAEPRRLQRAIELAITPGAILPDDDSGDRWTVWGKSEYPYTVNLSVPSCTCEDAARGYVLRCKHNLAILLLVRAHALEVARASAPETAPKRRVPKLRAIVVKRAPRLEDVTRRHQEENAVLLAELSTR